MSVEVKTGAGFEAGVPKALFQTRIFASSDPHAFRYGVAADGKRFLIDTVGGDESATSPFSVVLNWKAGRHLR